MKHTTKTIASLMVVSAVAAALPGVSQLKIGSKRTESQFERLLQRHDRKGEIRADVLGVTPAKFKQMQKRMTNAEIYDACGFPSARSFRIALSGRLKNELRVRGWSTRQINQYLHDRAPRLAMTPMAA